MTPATWTDWPARRSPARAGFAAAVVLGSVAAIAPIEPVLAALGAALLLGATGEVLLPTRYTLDSEGVETSTPLGRRRRAWSQLGRWRATPEGFAVDGEGPAGILRRQRALRLRAPSDPAAVEGWLIERLGPAAPGASS